MMFFNNKMTNIAIIISISLILFSPIASSNSKSQSDQINSTHSPTLPSQGETIESTDFEKPGETLNTTSAESSSSSGSTTTTSTPPVDMYTHLLI